MEKNKARSVIESVLFAMGDAVELKTLAAVLEMSEKDTKAVIDEMIEDAESESSGVRITQIEDGYQMSTKAENYEYLIKIISAPRTYRLTDVQLETLSIIAYKQPVTKADIEKIRGVSADHAVNRLLETGLIEERGRVDAPGRAILFGTTKEFLRRFGLKNAADLPGVDMEKVETFKLEAENEIGYYPEGQEASRLSELPVPPEDTDDIEEGGSSLGPGPGDEIIDVEI